MTKVLMGLRWAGGAPTLEQIEERFGLDPKSIDESFGVIEIDPDERLFALRLDDEEAHKLLQRAGDQAEGPFSDPAIATFGPPRA